jgi:hypothetical protein
MMKVVILIITSALLLSSLSGLVNPIFAQQKVTICHIPPGNPENAHTIAVNNNAVPSHLAHGDTLGACSTGPPPPPTDTKITITKVVNGPHSPEDFTICVTTSNDPNSEVGGTPATPPCAPGSGSGFTYIIENPGYLFITEIPPSSYTMHHQCQSPINAGEDRLCTVINDFTG